LLGAKRTQLGLLLAALLLCLPALGTGMVLDDHVLRVLARDPHGLAGHGVSPLFLFTFTDGVAADNHAMMDKGTLLPWYTEPLHRNAFFRPLSSLTHLLDFALAPNAAAWMHLHSILWFALLLAMAAQLYRTLASSGPAIAMLGFALFALDDAHAMTVGWIANRNALIAAAFALPAVTAHHRWLAQSWRPGAWVGPLCFALGLCAGETAVAVFGYLLAYAIALDGAPLLRRAWHLAPYVALLLIWRVLFAALGLGSFGSGAYHDPGQEPLGFARGLIEHVPVLLSAQLSLPLADNWFWGPDAQQDAIWVFSSLSMLGFAALGHVLLRHDREARFWALGMVLSACAVAASLPGERLLLVPGIGGAAFMAKLIAALHARVRGAAGARIPARLVLGALVLLHLIAAPVLLPLRMLTMGLLHTMMERTDASVPRTPDIQERTVVVLNAPFDVACSYFQSIRQGQGVPQPAHVYWLAVASSPLDLTVIDDHTLSMRPERGFLLSAPERHYRSHPETLAPGTHVQLGEMDVEIVDSTADRRPQTARFRFHEPLRSPRYLFMRFDGKGFVPWQPAAAGSRERFVRRDLIGVLAAEALRGLGPPR
jgi:hypothetical protein